MITLEQFNQLQQNRKFDAIDKDGNKRRACIDKDGDPFVFAKGSRKFGHYFSKHQFLKEFTLVTHKKDENAKWKSRLKRAVSLLEESGLWEKIKEKFKNLYESEITLDEKNQIYRDYFSCRYNDCEAFDKFAEKWREKYPFMFYQTEENRWHINTDYIFELSDCRLKSIYFGKYYHNEEKKNHIAECIKNKISCNEDGTTSYDVTFNYDAEKNAAWYSEEYKGCGNGHYYLALNHSTAVFYEND